MLTIGFATEFYTLWDVSTEDIYSTVETSSGTMSFKSGVKIHYWFQKNISKDLNKVLELYPNLRIDEELRGQSRSWSTTKEIDETPHILKFGKHAGKTVSEVADQDWDYFIWLINNCYKAATREECHKVQKYVDYLAEIERKAQERFDAIDRIPAAGGEIELQFDTNPNCYAIESIINNGDMAGNDYREVLKGVRVAAWAKFGNNSRICVVFTKEQVHYVEGLYPYYMALINRKFKRIKNKAFKLQVEVLTTKEEGSEVVQVVKIK